MAASDDDSDAQKRKLRDPMTSLVPFHPPPSWTRKQVRQRNALPHDLVLLIELPIVQLCDPVCVYVWKGRAGCECASHEVNVPKDVKRCQGSAARCARLHASHSVSNSTGVRLRCVTSRILRAPVPAPLKCCKEERALVSRCHSTGAMIKPINKARASGGLILCLSGR